MFKTNDVIELIDPEGDGGEPYRTIVFSTSSDGDKEHAHGKAPR